MKLLIALIPPILLLSEENLTNIPKRTLNSNMTLNYQLTPPDVQNVNDFFDSGIFYGRLRFNNFFYKANSHTDAKDYFLGGVGSSLIYKSAFLNGFGFTTGLYTSQVIGDREQELATAYKSGKDVLSRYDVATQDYYGLTTLAELFVEYKSKKSRIKVGYFPLETLLLKSNDTKMIPNTFEGIHLSSTPLPKTELQVAYISQQKLRDHTEFHHILAYGKSPNSPYSQWSENDDGAMHRGLTLNRLTEKSIDDELFLLEVKDRTFQDTTLKASYTALPNLLSSLIVDGKHKFQLNSDLSISPSLRYMRQFDLGAGAIGGANLKTNTTGYHDIDSLDSSLIAGRIDFAKENNRLRFGYSKVEDAGDIVAPWRGFPTGGYTRAMGQTNWYANTESFMVRADHDFSKTPILKGLKGMVRYNINNFDDSKEGVQADNQVLTIDFIKNFNSMPNFSTKLRTAFVTGDRDTPIKNGSTKKDPSYKEIRFEMNYLF